MLTKESILEQVKKNVEDPEIGMNVVDLGLIYEINIDNKNVELKMTMTTPMCPAADIILGQTKECIRNLGAENVSIELIWDPPWGPEKMSEEGKAQMEMMGL